jgi:hypothetical protein
VHTVEKAGRFETAAVPEALCTHEFDTMLGHTGYDTFIRYVWKDGKYPPVSRAS